jgi:DNA ligase (NAD+)
MDLERMGDKSAQNVLDSIAQSKGQPLDRLLAGLGIRHVGNRVAFVLASNFGSLDDLAAASVDALSSVHEIGEVIAQSVHDFFRSPAGRDAVAQLKSVGVNPKMDKPPPAADLPLAGQSIVVTGTLQTLKRDEIEQLITQLGGRPSGSVSKKTSFLIAGEDAGSKLDKANQLGVSVLTENQFLQKIGRKAK